MSIGSILIVLAAVLAGVAFVTALGWARGRPSWERTFRWSYGGMTTLLAIAAILLMRAILAHDFRYDYVVGYSSRDLPFIYLVSAFWGGQEGTYLLWALFAAILGYPLLRKRSWNPAAVMAAYTPMIWILILFMLNRNGNPFRLSPVVPPDGRGLNPLLQDPWMAIHPPIVFLGYAAMSVPAALAWVAAFKREEKNWVSPALRYTLFGFLTLGIGIVLGGVWAYKVLGWGGFWGWDPVENASLIPWIVGTALIHGLLVQQSTGALRRTNLILAMAGYVLVMYSTFLTRSGVLADFSVHSFPKGTIYGWLVAALILIVGTSLVALFRRPIPEGAPIETKVAWPFVLTTTIVLFAISAFMVLVGTSWPILSSMAGKPSTPTAPFYNQVNRPVYLILLAILGLAPFLAWAALPARMWARRLLPSVFAAAGGTVIAILMGAHGVWAIALFFTALIALVSNLLRLFEMLRKNPMWTGAAVAHIGFALMFVGIIASESWDRTQHVQLPLGQPVQALGATLTYQGQVSGSEPKLRWKVEVAEPGSGAVPAEVTMYNTREEQLFRKPAIRRHARGDLYIAPAGLDRPEPADAGGALTLKKNEPVDYQGASLTFERFDMGGGHMGGGMVVNAIVHVLKDDQHETVTLPLEVGDQGMVGTPVPVAALGGAALTLKGMSVEQGTIQVAVPEAAGGSDQAGATETLSVDVSRKPLIWLLWLGTILLAVGCAIALVRRATERRAAAVPEANGKKVAARA